MTNKEIESKLLTFNSDPQAKKIRNYYNRKSFMEILSKSRNENTHSAFIAWLLQGEGLGLGDDAPLMHFLDILVKNDAEGCIQEPFRSAILSRTLRLANVEVETEKLVKDVSIIPATDRFDIFVEGELSSYETDYKGVRIVIENKINSEEILTDKSSGEQSGGTMDLGLRRANNKRQQAQAQFPEYFNEMSQTERYYHAVAEMPIKKDYFNIFVFLTPDGKKASDPHFIPVTYQDIMDFVLDPLMNVDTLDPMVSLYLKEYTRALSVPAISEDDTNYTVLAVSEWEQKQLNAFKEKYGDLIAAAAAAYQGVGTSSEDDVLTRFWNKNLPLFLAVYYSDPNSKNLFKTLSTRDYTKYTLSYGGNEVGKHLGKRKLILAAFKEMLDNSIKIPDTDKNNRPFYYVEADFVKKHKAGEISDDTFNNRYTPVDYKGAKYYVLNQWGIGNWDWVEETLSDKGFSIEAE